ncbi:universal stress protein [Devosia salina]|uniref:Universal stress protein n=1 Tax=Devosia salina TaxID=2860336 RepID=A0ABX8WHR5_9HYPH|nr:universal stress protein [Devosia salina]QYO78313.1 universal stress protein [Devosia salina]
MIKDIVVHLTGSSEDKFRLDCAEKLAGRFDAHLTGLLVHIEPEIVAMPEAGYADVLQSLVAEALEKTEQRRAILAKRFSEMVVPGDLRVVSGLRGTVGDELAAEARTSDLFVGTRPYGDPDRGHRIEEGVLFKSGRPCVLLPPEQVVPFDFETVLVAWKNTRESARAVRDAIPFLQKARTVTVVLSTGEPDEERRASSGADIARYLSRHGVTCEVRELSGWHAAQDALLNEIEATQAQLVVAGAFGHSRLQERLLGGVTRALLERCPVPVLVSR